MSANVPRRNHTPRDGSYRPQLDHPLSRLRPGGHPGRHHRIQCGRSTEITAETAHRLSTGDVVTISGHTGSDVDLNGDWIVTVISTTTFTIPVAVTTGATGGTVEKKGVSEVSAYATVTIEGVVPTQYQRWRQSRTKK